MSNNTDISLIRNFAIVAHIDHGKTTLSDCLIKICSTVSANKMQNQFLDNLDVERERGITVKAQTICMKYHFEGKTYTLNLIDTPGHVDFYYEVSRAMKACEGAVLVVDATQGVEAQTLSNAQYAKQADLKIITAFNKIDLPTADPDGVEEQVADLLDIYEEPVLVSAKSGLGIEALIESIIKKIPAPTGDEKKPLQALLVDSWYDQYFGVVLLVRIMNGVARKGMQVDFLARGKRYKIEEVGVMANGKQETETLSAGEIGYMVVNIKTLADCHIGDTIAEPDSDVLPLPGFKKNLPIVFCGLFPTDREDHALLDKSLTRLSINDSSFSFERIQSPMLGMGFRCGFLGMLHMDVIMQRLENEFEVTAIMTVPSVHYKVFLKDGSCAQVHNPTQMPELNQITHIDEPMVLATIFVPHEHLGGVIELCSERAGTQEESQIIGNRTMLLYRMPLREIVFDFYDELKSRSHGYASFDYELADYATSDIVALQILINGKAVDALSSMVHREQVTRKGREICLQLKENLDRQQVPIAIQAAVGANIVARETVPAYRKDVTAKLYGGDRTRKDKLLKKQAKGKKKMRELAAEVASAEVAAEETTNGGGAAANAQPTPEVADAESTAAASADAEYYDLSDELCNLQLKILDCADMDFIPIVCDMDPYLLDTLLPMLATNRDTVTGYFKSTEFQERAKGYGQQIQAILKQEAEKLKPFVEFVSETYKKQFDAGKLEKSEASRFAELKAKSSPGVKHTVDTMIRRALASAAHKKLIKPEGSSTLNMQETLRKMPREHKRHKNDQQYAKHIAQIMDNQVLQDEVAEMCDNFIADITNNHIQTPADSTHLVDLSVELVAMTEFIDTAIEYINVAKSVDEWPEDANDHLGAIAELQGPEAAEPDAPPPPQGAAAAPNVRPAAAGDAADNGAPPPPQGPEAAEPGVSPWTEPTDAAPQTQEDAADNGAPADG